MDFIAQERDRLLRSATRVVGIVCALVSVVGILSAAAVPTPPLIGALLCIAAMITALVCFARGGEVWWTAAIVVAGLATMVLLFTGVPDSARPLVASAVMPLAAGGLSAPLMAQRGHPVGLGITIAGGGAVVVLMVWGSGMLQVEPLTLSRSSRAFIGRT